jgi:hypothetical protein
MQTANERARFYVEGVGSAITAEVARRGARGMVVAQPLPFLRLDTKVVGEDGTHARIARVAIAMDGDVPRLLLKLEHDEPDALEVPEFVPGVSTRPERPCSTVPYALERREEGERATIVIREERARAAIVARTTTRATWWQRLIRRLTVLLEEIVGPLPA